MTLTRLTRENGRGPQGTPGTPGSPDNVRIPLVTPGSMGINDKVATFVEGAKPSKGLHVIWLTLTDAERACTKKNENLWNNLVTGKSSHLFYKDFAGFFEFMSKKLALLGGETEVEIQESSFTIINRIYDRLCKYEYDQINKELQKAFVDQSNANNIQPAWRYYRSLRGGYVRQGMTYPYLAINAVDPKMRFLGKPVWKGVHKDLGELLKKVESRLKSKGELSQVTQDLQLKHWGGFVPRFIAGKTIISKHSIGLAIDIEYPTNPHLKGAVGKHIDAALDYMQKKGVVVKGRIRQSFQGHGNISMHDIDRLIEISDTIRNFLREWIPKWESMQETLCREQELSSSSRMENEWGAIAKELGLIEQNKEPLEIIGKLIKAWGGVAKVKKVSQVGLVTLEAALFHAMKAEGVECGIEWKRHKDIMHFEFPGSLRKWAKTKGYTK